MKPITKAAIMILGASVITTIFVIPRVPPTGRVKSQPLPNGWYEVDSKNFDLDNDGVLSVVEQDKMWDMFRICHKDLKGLALRSNKTEQK